MSEDTPMNTDDRALADLIGQALTKVAGPQTYYRTDDVVAAVSHLIAADRLEAFHVKPVVGERYSASGDHVVDVDDHNTFQVVPVNRVDGDSLAISVAEAMNAALSTPVAAQGDEVREALEIIFREWDARTDPSAEMPGWPDDPAAVMNDAWKNGFYDKAKAALATLGAPHEG